MSERLFGNDVLFLQRLLSCCGLYPHKLDGDWGPKTDASARAFDQQCAAIAGNLGTFDARSERNIRSLQVKAQTLCRQSLKKLHAQGLDARVISGTRTYAEQTALYRQGRSEPGKIVTNAKAGQSWHNFGMAWDIGLFDNGRYVTAVGPYNGAAKHAILPGIQWGGHWTKFNDPPHYQVTEGHPTVSAMRMHFEAGGR